MASRHARSSLRALQVPSLAIALSLCGGGPAEAQQQKPAPPPPPARAPDSPSFTLTPAQIAEQALASVVFIRTPGKLGSGFVVSADGQIATNMHVIAGATEAVVVLHDNREFKDVQVLGADPDHDLVVLQVPVKGLLPLRLGDSGQVKAGEHVVAIGHPLGLGNTVSDGLVSAVRVISESLTLLQISAPIAAGSSGGPLLNDRGEVIAVATLTSNKGQNLNFGVPVSYLKPLLAETRLRPLSAFVKEAPPERPQAGAPVRIVPKHELKVLETCTRADIEHTATGIANAITLGAPLYNDGNHEACYRIYEGAALELKQKLHRCRGVKDALSVGVKRAAGQVSYTDKAWSMRDAFDGLIDVIQRKLSLPGGGFVR